MYAGLTFLLSPDQTLLIQLFMPIVMLVTYLVILGKPGKILPSDKQVNSSTQEADQSQKGSDDVTIDDSKPLLGEVADIYYDKNQQILRGKLEFRGWEIPRSPPSI